MKTNINKKKNFFQKYVRHCSFLLVLFFMLFAFSGIEAQTVLYEQDFEKGGDFYTIGGVGVFYDNKNIKQSGSSGVSISKEHKKSGNYAIKFDVDRTKGYYRRASIVFNNAPGNGAMKFHKDYWISFDYYRSDWKKDSKDKDVGPLDMHDVAPAYPDVQTNISCRPNGGNYYNNAPMFFQSQNGKLRLVSYGGKMLWEGPILYKQWVSLKVHFRASTGADGIVEAWRNGKKLGNTARGANVPAVDKCANKYGAYKRPFLKLGNYHPAWWDKATVDAYIEKNGQYESERRVFYMDNIVIAEGDATLATDEFQNNKDITISPNPSANEINIQFPEVIKVESIGIYDIQGKEVFTKEITTSEKEITIQPNLASGIYILKLDTAEKGLVSKKIIVE